MIRNHVTPIIVSLLFMNYSGCFPYQEVRTEDKAEIEKGGKVKITTTNDEVYFLTNVSVTDSLIKGIEKLNEYQNKEKILPISKIKTNEPLRTPPRRTELPKHAR